MNDLQTVTEITDAQKEFAANALHNLPFAQLIGMRLVDLKLDEAVIAIEMRDDLRQPSGVLHGGVTATLDRYGNGICGSNPARADGRDSDDRPDGPLSSPAR